MEATGRKLTRVTIVWMLVGALVALIVVRLADRSGPIQAEERRLDNIELIATATTFDEGPTYSGKNNLLRGNFVGSLFSTDPACQASRSLTVVWENAGSVADAEVAFSTSDNTGNTGNFTTTEWHDPPGEDSYHVVVAPDEAKDCEGAVSETIIID